MGVSSTAASRTKSCENVCTWASFDWDGKDYTGSHEPLVTRECWQRVQELLDARAENKTRKVKHDFAFTGLVHCGHCGCLFVGEIKKSRSMCTITAPATGENARSRTRARRSSPASSPTFCRNWSFRSRSWNGSAIACLDSDQTEQAARAQAIKRLQAQHDQIEARIETMYMDKLDGRITQEFFDKQCGDAAAMSRMGLRARSRKIQNAAPAPIDQAVDMLRLTSRASELFLQQPAAEQRRLLQVVVEKAAWQDGALRTTLFEPFEILRHSNQESHRKEKENGGSWTRYWKFGSSGRIRTYNPSVNSRMLYR